MKKKYCIDCQTEHVDKIEFCCNCSAELENITLGREYSKCPLCIDQINLA
jgi:hypothetical protein